MVRYTLWFIKSVPRKQPSRRRGKHERWWFCWHFQWCLCPLWWRHYRGCVWSPAVLSSVGRDCRCPAAVSLLEKGNKNWIQTKTDLTSTYASRAKLLCEQVDDENTQNEVPTQVAIDLFIQNTVVRSRVLYSCLRFIVCSNKTFKINNQMCCKEQTKLLS